MKEVTKKQKIQIIENNLNQLKAEEFDLQIRKDVFKEAGLDERLDKVADDLILNRKLQKGYKDRLDKLQAEKDSEEENE